MGKTTEIATYKPKLRSLAISEQTERRSGVAASGANIKHRTMLQVLYSTGLRVSKLIGLRIGDIDSGRNTITVRHGKGAKDRQIPCWGCLPGARRA